MKLSVVQRLTIKNILPQKANYIELVLKKDIIEKIDLAQDEIKKINFKVVAQGDKSNLIWDKEKEEPLEVDFTEAERGLIRPILETLDVEKKLDDNTGELYKLFNL